MKERPILFSGEMVRAILEGRKTQTRRVVTLKEFQKGDKPGIWYFRDKKSRWQCLSTGELAKKCPYGVPGDRLWVRETWDFVVWNENEVLVGYGADGGQSRPIKVPDKWNPMMYNYQRWRPSIHMPRWASRITLDVVAVRVERVQNITNEDILAEGITMHSPVRKKDPLPTPRSAFASLWDAINKTRGFGWDVNPWVWVIEFQKVGK